MGLTDRRPWEPDGVVHVCFTCVCPVDLLDALEDTAVGLWPFMVWGSYRAWAVLPNVRLLTAQEEN